MEEHVTNLKSYSLSIHTTQAMKSSVILMFDQDIHNIKSSVYFLSLNHVWISHKVSSDYQPCQFRTEAEHLGQQIITP